MCYSTECEKVIKIYRHKPKQNFKAVFNCSCSKSLLIGVLRRLYDVNQDLIRVRLAPDQYLW